MLRVVVGLEYYLLMARVADDESDVIFRCECDSIGDIGRLDEVDCVISVIALGARPKLWRVWVTSLVGVEGCHDRWR